MERKKKKKKIKNNSAQRTHKDAAAGPKKKIKKKENGTWGFLMQGRLIKKIENGKNDNTRMRNQRKGRK